MDGIVALDGKKFNTVIDSGICREYYYFMPSEGRERILKSSQKVEGTDPLWVGYLEKPLERGDKFYISEKDVMVTISGVVRTSTGGYIYESDRIEIIYDEKSEESKLDAERQLEEALKKRAEEVEERPSTSWMQRLFGRRGE